VCGYFLNNHRFRAIFAYPAGIKNIILNQYFASFSAQSAVLARNLYSKGQERGQGRLLPRQKCQTLI
jgi:hypothetical protein